MTAGFLCVSTTGWVIFLALNTIAFWAIIVLVICKVIRDGQRPLPMPPEWLAPPIPKDPR